MAIDVWCECGRRGQARDEFAGRRAQCPSCGRTLQIPDRPAEPKADAGAAVGPATADVSRQPQPVPVTEYLEPPAAPVAQPEKPPYLRLMFEALLAPQSIQWMLDSGWRAGGLGPPHLADDLGVFENPYVLAAALGAGTVAVLAAGWWVTLRTRFRVAGQALTFLGCVVASLNLWFYQTQGLLTVDRGLWAGGLVCCLLYAATVYVLRDPLFMYAVEAGLTLTVGLLMTEVCRGIARRSVCLRLPGPDGHGARLHPCGAGILAGGRHVRPQAVRDAPVLVRPRANGGLPADPPGNAGH